MRTQWLAHSACCVELAVTQGLGDKRIPTVNTFKAAQWSSGKGWLLMPRKSSRESRDKEENQDSAILRKSSVCCSGYETEGNAHDKVSTPGERLATTVQRLLETAPESLLCRAHPKPTSVGGDGVLPRILSSTVPLYTQSISNQALKKAQRVKALPV